MEQNKVVVFQEKQIRRIWHNDEWFFNVADVMGILTDSHDPKSYWRQLKKRLLEKEGAFESVTNCHALKFEALDGKKYTMDAANTQTLFRLVMSVPSPKVEPLKVWLAQVGKDRLDEIENPELAAERARELYKAKGYPDDWIETRLKSIDVRQQLTDEWKNRDVKEGTEYSILTAEIAKATFGLTPTEHKQVKGLEKQNLRDHMTTLELIFTMLGEESTRQLSVDKDAKGFNENRETAIEGGEAAGQARLQYEKRIGKKVVSPTNFLKQIKGDKDK
jgi:DNA-damage-inducible protein D